MRQPHHLLPQPNLSVLVLGFGLRHLDRLDQVLHRLVEAHVAGRRALLEVLDDEVVRIPHVVMGSHAPAGETHRSTTSSYRPVRYARRRPRRGVRRPLLAEQPVGARTAGQVALPAPENTPVVPFPVEMRPSDEGALLHLVPGENWTSQTGPQHTSAVKPQPRSLDL